MSPSDRSYRLPRAPRRHNPPNPIATARRFCRHYLGRDCFAPFTGQDFSAWCSFVYACELYGRTDSRAICIAAMTELLRSAQSKVDVQAVFLWTVPAILDWSHADEVWPLVATDELGALLMADMLADLHKRQRAHREATT